MSKETATIGGLMGLVLGLIIPFYVLNGRNLLTGFTINASALLEPQIEALTIRFVIVVFTTVIGTIIGGLLTEIGEFLQ